MLAANAPRDAQAALAPVVAAALLVCVSQLHFLDLPVRATIIVFAGLKWVLDGSRVGRLVRMVAEDPKLAMLAGVNVRWVYYGVFAFEGAAVAFAAGMVAPRTPILTSMGFDEVIMTFVVVVLGGIGSVTGSYVALYQAFQRLVSGGLLNALPLRDSVAAISCGVVAGAAVLDLDYAEDSQAETDANFVMTGAGSLVEV